MNLAGMSQYMFGARVMMNPPVMKTYEFNSKAPRTAPAAKTHYRMYNDDDGYRWMDRSIELR